MSSCSCGASSQAVGPHAGEHLALRRHAEQLVARGEQRRVAVAAAVLQAEGEAGRVAELGDRRRTQREDERVAHARQIAPNARPAIACAECSGPLRSPQAFSVTNASAAFWPCRRS